MEQIFIAEPKNFKKTPDHTKCGNVCKYLYVRCVIQCFPDYHNYQA